MADHWKAIKAGDVQPGNRVRTTTGVELVVSRIEPAFFGLSNMVAFIEDTPQRWLKQPFTVDADVDVLVQD